MAHITIMALYRSHVQLPVGSSKKQPRMTSTERADGISLRVRMYPIMGLLKCLYISTLAGNKV
jgi:hypothetical protein